MNRRWMLIAMLVMLPLVVHAETAYQVHTSTANLYANPNPSSQIVGTTVHGMTFHAIQMKNNFIYVSIQNKPVGWIEKAALIKLPSSPNFISELLRHIKQLMPTKQLPSDSAFIAPRCAPSSHMTWFFSGVVTATLVLLFILLLCLCCRQKKRAN